jgi:MoaA/NifB/PqqE/SkfB family radical SAM enzyme
MNIKLLGKYARFGYNHINSLVLTELSLLTGKNFSKPRQAYYLMSSKCNVRCEMCPEWEKGMTEKSEDRISTGRMKEVLRKLAAWRISKFGISGGEPLIFRDKMFELLSTANSLGMYTHFATNAWLLDNDVFTTYEKMGGGHISMSLDGIGDTHDELRNKPGLFNKCMGAIETYRSLGLRNVRMKINAVLSRKNLDDIAPLIKISDESGIPIFFQPVDTYDYASMMEMTQDDLSRKHMLWIPSSQNELLNETVGLIREYKRRSPHLVLNTEKHLDLIGPYFRNEMLAGMKRRCLVAYDTVSIFPDGTMRVCWIGTVGNLKEQGVKEIYYSEKSDKAREKSQKCNYPCMLGCLIRPGIFELINVGLRNVIRS